MYIEQEPRDGLPTSHLGKMETDFLTTSVTEPGKRCRVNLKPETEGVIHEIIESHSFTFVSGGRGHRVTVSGSRGVSTSIGMGLR